MRLLEAATMSTMAATSGERTEGNDIGEGGRRQGPNATGAADGTAEGQGRGGQIECIADKTSGETLGATMAEHGPRGGTATIRPHLPKAMQLEDRRRQRFAA